MEYFGRFITILLMILSLLLLPSFMLLTKTQRAREQYIRENLQEFVDEILLGKELTQEKYMRFEEKLSRSGLLYECHIKIALPISNGTGDTSLTPQELAFPQGTGIEGLDTYHRVYYHEEILQYLFSTSDTMEDTNDLSVFFVKDASQGGSLVLRDGMLLSVRLQPRKEKTFGFSFLSLLWKEPSTWIHGGIV